MEDLKNLIVSSTQDNVRTKVLELIQCWTSAFKGIPDYKIVGDTHSLLKMNGFEFPPIDEAKAMFLAESAPDWAEGDNCYRLHFCFAYAPLRKELKNSAHISIQYDTIFILLIWPDVALSLASLRESIIAALVDKSFVTAVQASKCYCQTLGLKRKCASVKHVLTKSRHNKHQKLVLKKPAMLLSIL
jgi:hypothetical protein